MAIFSTHKETNQITEVVKYYSFDIILFYMMITVIPNVNFLIMQDSIIHYA